MGSHPDGHGRPGSGRALLWGQGVAGAVLLGFSAVSIHAFADDLARRAPTVVWNDGGWAALPASLSLLSLAAALHVARRDGPGVAGPRKVLLKRLLALAACLLPLVIVVPLAARWIAASQLEARGYAHCGGGLWQRPTAAGDGTPRGAACRADQSAEVSSGTAV